MAKRGGLGRGLDGLLGVQTDALEDRVQMLSLDELRPNPWQPRRVFDEEALEELKESIIEHGVIQPILVKKVQDGYEIIAGERRYRAAMMAKIKEIPAIVREVSEEDQAKIALIENLQRKNLNSVEEAQGFNRLLEEYELTQQELSQTIGKSRVHVTNSLRLLQLPEEVLQMISQDQLSAGHGRALLMFDESKQIAMAKMASSKGLSVRVLESMAKKSHKDTKVIEKKKDLFIEDVERRLTDALGTKVTLKKSRNKHIIEITYYSAEELNEFLDQLL